MAVHNWDHRVQQHWGGKHCVAVVASAALGKAVPPLLILRSRMFSKQALGKKKASVTAVRVWETTHWYLFMPATAKPTLRDYRLLKSRSEGCLKCLTVSKTPRVLS